MWQGCENRQQNEEAGGQIHKQEFNKKIIHVLFSESVFRA